MSIGRSATLLHGRCHCGAVAVEFASDTAASELHPRACDCSFCCKHGARWISDPAARMRILAHGSRLQRYQQGSGQAAFLLCAGCGVLVAVTHAHEGRLFGALSAACLESPPQLGAASQVSPQLLGPDEKRTRWQQVWVPDVEVVVTP